MSFAVAAPRERRGLTLVEVVVVVTIVLVLAGLLMPTLTAAKRSGLQVTGTSNLRQQGLALLLYFEQTDSVASPPLQPQALGIVPAVTACSPLDEWHRPCLLRDSPRPMLGSFGYVPDMISYSWDFPDTAVSNGTWEEMRVGCKTVPLLVDPFVKESDSCAWYNGSFFSEEGGQQYVQWMQACERQGHRHLTRSTVGVFQLDGSLGTYRQKGEGIAAWAVWLQSFFGTECRK